MLSKLKIASFLGGFGFSMSTIVSAVPLSLAQSPLIAAQAVSPNIMILFDTSGSMQEVIMESTTEAPAKVYDPNVTYGSSCGGSYDFSSSGDREYALTVDSNGVAQIEYYNNGNLQGTYYWGTSGGTSTYRCFDPGRTYDADLVSGDSTNFFPPYSGSYLNWYFTNNAGTASEDFGNSSATRRPGVKMRTEVGKDAITQLIGAVGDPDRLQNVRMGLAGFDANNDRAEFESKLVDIDVDANRNSLLSAVGNLDADGGTPLASSLASLGRYFIDGHTSEYVDSNKDGVVDSSAGDVTSGTLFPGSGSIDNDPDYGAESAPVANEVIEYSCQKNFIVALTDGTPTSDDNYTDSVARWNDGTTNHSSGGTGDFDDIAQALYDLDWRSTTFPNDYNNITTYPIGFTIDLPMLQRAADNSGGIYYQADDATTLANSLQSIANNVQAQVSTSASVAFNSGRLVTGSSVFQAKFNTAKYSGELLSYALASDGSIAATETWEAGAKLDALADSAVLDLTGRQIFTYDNTLINPEGIPFVWGSLNSEQKDDLAYPAVATDPNYATDGQAVLDYIKGDTSNEGLGASNFRQRDSRLGDIVNSTPVFVGAPELNWPDYADNNLFGSSSSSYSAFKVSQASRTPVVYVGANDGMLHGFEGGSTSSDGDEVFAYIPGEVYSSANATSGLHYLASQSYDHAFYVDLTPTVSDVFIPTVTSGTASWRTVLLGGTRGGGRGLFALDITNPGLFANAASNAASVVLWEFTNGRVDSSNNFIPGTGDPEMGYTYSQPSIVMMPNGRWAAITGNGYNSDSEQAYLFIIYLDGGLDGVWTEDTDYRKIPTNSQTSNGLSSPRVVDLDGDSVADRVYAGDLQGNMWVFDVSDTDHNNWDLADSNPLFTAISDNGTSSTADDYVQPITSAPILAENSNVNTTSGNSPNVLVLFGTGKFLEPSDTSTNLDLQSYYGVWDSGDFNLDRDDLVSRELITETVAVNDPTTSDPNDTVDKRLRSLDASLSSTAINFGSGDYGWYFNLEDKSTPAGTPTLLGERVVTDSLLRREVLFFNTIIPDNVACSGGGTGWLLSVDFLTGLAPDFAVFDANNDGVIDNQDLGYIGEEFLEGIPSKSGVLGDYQYTPGSKGTIEKREIEVGGGVKEGRLSWEELFRN